MELEARVKRMAGIRGDDADWPVVVWNGEVIGTLAELEEFIEHKPPDEHVAEETEWEHGQAEEPQFQQERHNAATQHNSNMDDHPGLEASMNVLDMRLSVLGNQFRDTALAQSKYPELHETGEEDGAKTPTAKVGPASPNGGVDAQSPLRTVDLALEGLEWAVLKVNKKEMCVICFASKRKVTGNVVVARIRDNSAGARS